MNKIYSNKNKIYSNKNKIYRNTHVNKQKSTTVLEDPGTQQRCFRMCGWLKQCVSNISSFASVAVLHVCRSASCLQLMLAPGVRQTGSCKLLGEHVKQRKKKSC